MDVADIRRRTHEITMIHFDDMAIDDMKSLFKELQQMAQRMESLPKSRLASRELLDCMNKIAKEALKSATGGEIVFQDYQ